MSRYRRAAGTTFFFTLVSYQRQRILCDAPIRHALRAAVARVRKARPFDIDAWVLLPDHLHCIWTLPVDDADFSTRWRLIKRYVSLTCRDQYRGAKLLSPSRARRNESTIWQRRFWEHRIDNDRDFAQHVDYIHSNPVKHGVVSQAVAWPYSTIHRYVRLGIYANDWAIALPPLSTHGE